MTENEISYQIRGAVFDVYNTLGPGLLETMYEAAMVYELRRRGLEVEQQKKITVGYRDITLPLDYRLDLLVEDKVIVELKSVTELTKLHFLQLHTYLKVTGLKLGLLVNFNCADLKDNRVRVANGL